MPLCSGRSYNPGMTYFMDPMPNLNTHVVVTCKGCRKNISAGVHALPKDNIVVKCPLCGELRRYRPGEVSMGPRP